MSSIIEKNNQYVANTYARFPVEIAYGKGSKVYSPDGKEYIDMGSGIGVTAFGICDDEWKNAVISQLDKVQHTSNLYYTSPCAELAELLCNKTGMKKVFFSNSGAESNECAIKVARQYGIENKGADYTTIITLKNSFHGRTLATLSATGQDVFHAKFLPMPQGFVHGVANDIESIKTLVKENKVCGILIECVQGEGGVIALNKEFVQGIEKLCKENDILFMVDEVQTGNGRTGELYAYMNYGVSPDVITTAKGLGGGLPIGCCMMNEKTEKVLGFGDHGSTYGGNPICATGAISVISRLDNKFLSGVKAKSKYIFDELKGAEGIESVSGLGLMVGVKTKKPAKDVVNECINRGVICLTAKDKVRLLPALNIPQEDLEVAIQTLKAVCAE